MPNIEIDFDVFKAITLRRPSETTTENDVLREVFGLPPKKVVPTAPTVPGAGDWVAKGVRFPMGTEFRAIYKGQTYLGRVDAGALVLEGKRYDSPSSAAVSITGSNVNGWRFWEARLPGQSGWKMIESLRRQ
ncbi:MAG: DUF2924 domain-containing protein [Proteobacteria bacterium]|nr:DUF2924 domain-containing protein [Pseudomonadota bacterium]